MKKQRKKIFEKHVAIAATGAITFTYGKQHQEAAMGSHSKCAHAQSPAARRTCRLGREIVAYAEKLGLVAEYRGDSKVVMQINFKKLNGHWMDTHITWTTCYSGGRNQIGINQFSRIKEERGIKALKCWLWVISDRPV